MEKQRRNPGDAAWRACVGQQKGGGGPRDGYWRRVASQGGEGQQAGGAYRGGGGLPSFQAGGRLKKDWQGPICKFGKVQVAGSKLRFAIDLGFK